MNLDQTGLLRCAHYAYSPNLLHFCGPDKQADLAGYIKHNVTDNGLVEIVNQFETVYPYLRLIAGENNIGDPFANRVVEAYWTGNSLLNNVKPRPLAGHLLDSLKLKHKLRTKELNKILSKLDSTFPQHNFHVLNIFCRTGHQSMPHTLATMDSCRISWGKVVKKQPHLLSSKTGNSLLVLTRPLVYDKDKLMQGKPVVKKVSSLQGDYQAGDWVSMHWGYVCEKLTSRQVNNLRSYTKMALDLANRERYL